MIPYIGDLVSNDLALRRSAPAPRRRTRCSPDLAGPGSSPACRDPHPGRRREDDLLPAAQGHAADARGAGARRHRLARARGRVLRAARLDAAPRAPPAAGMLVRRPLARARRARGRRVRRGEPHGRRAPRSASSTAGTRSRTSASSSGASSRAAARRRAPLGAAVAASTFSPLGNAAPLFTRARGARTTRRGLSTELHVPGPIRARLLRPRPAAPPGWCRRRTSPTSTGFRGPRPRRAADLAPDASLFVIVDGTAILPASVRCRRLDPWPAARPAGSVVGSTSSADASRSVRRSTRRRRSGSSYHYGFPAALGGGAYERRAGSCDSAIRRYRESPRPHRRRSAASSRP